MGNERQRWGARGEVLDLASRPDWPGSNPEPRPAEEHQHRHGEQRLAPGWGSSSPRRLGAEEHGRLCPARLVSLSPAAGDCRSPVKTELEEAGETALPVLRGSRNGFVFLVSISSWISP